MNRLTHLIAACLLVTLSIAAANASPQAFDNPQLPIQQASSKSPLVQPTIVCTQKSFVDAIAKNNAANLYQQMHPALKRAVDQPVLVAWMDAMKKKLGSVEVLKVAQETTDELKTGTRLTSEATIEFDEGKATSKIQTLNGQLVSFEVNSPELQDWFKGPATTTLYEDFGSDFIRRFMQEENTIVASMCHRALREKIEEPALSELIERVKRKTGELTSVTLKNKTMEFKPNSQKLFLNYNLECEGNDVTCEVAIQFIGMKGHLIGFNFK